MYLAVGVAMGIYVLVSLGVFGTLTPQEIQQHGDTALAYAAKPALGQAGFAMMALAALLATSSSVNANLYAAGGITASLAKEGLFPAVFGRRGPRGASVGLLLSGGLVLVLANAFDLTAIASIGSAVALIIFMLVSLAAMRLRRETGTRAAIVITAMVMTVVVLVLFAVDTLRNEPWTFAWMVVVALLAVVLDRISTHARDRGAALGTPSTSVTS